MVNTDTKKNSLCKNPYGRHFKFLLRTALKLYQKQNYSIEINRIRIGSYFISAPNTVPENVTAEATGNSTIRVKWSSVDISSISGFEGYSIKYEADGHPERRGENRTSNTNEYSLTGLRMFTRYKIRVAARTTQNGNYSKAVNATTWEGGKRTKNYKYNGICHL